ncbi:MAG: hypothetical protein K9M56_02845 [Victivallales bacterium]|nr:hypothetical protein [Victivallales bacterium]
MRKILIIIFLFSVYSLAAYNPIKQSAFEGYSHEGSFVEVPAYAGSAVGCIIMGYPAAIATEPLRLIVPNSPWCDIIGYYMIACTSKGFGAVFGSIPFLLKKAFYDLPAGRAGKTERRHPQKEMKLPERLITPPQPANSGKVENKAVEKDNIVEDHAITLHEEEKIKKAEHKKEKKGKEHKVKRQPPKAAETKSQKETEVTDEKKFYKENKKIKKKTVKKVPVFKKEKKPVKVSPELPSWVHEELKQNDK